MIGTGRPAEEIVGFLVNFYYIGGQYVIFLTAFTGSKGNFYYVESMKMRILGRAKILKGGMNKKPLHSAKR